MNIDKFRGWVGEFRRAAGDEKYMNKHRANYIWEQAKGLDDFIFERFFRTYIENAKLQPTADGLEGKLKKLLDPYTPPEKEETTPVEEIGFIKKIKDEPMPAQTITAKNKHEFKAPPGVIIRKRTSCCDHGLLQTIDKNGAKYFFRCSNCQNGEYAKNSYPNLPMWGPEYELNYKKV